MTFKKSVLIITIYFLKLIENNVCIATNKHSIFRKNILYKNFYLSIRYLKRLVWQALSRTCGIFNLGLSNFCSQVDHHLSEM